MNHAPKQWRHFRGFVSLSDWTGNNLVLHLDFFMNCLVLQGDEQTAAVAGFVNIEYHFLRFVLILKDGKHLPFFLRSLTLPARPRLNDFRW